jgi:hypothetical protein
MERNRNKARRWIADVAVAVAEEVVVARNEGSWTEQEVSKRIGWAGVRRYRKYSGAGAVRDGNWRGWRDWDGVDNGWEGRRGAARTEGGTPVILVAPVGRWIVEGTVTRTDDPVLVGLVGLVGLVQVF